ncbi:hypothetical protein VTN02DRAFT_2529 [Thermoascus thermophilus]
MTSNSKADRAQERQAEAASASAPRKRRKRTVGSGAADDCFTCASRGTKCDRRRPYCSQCLDLGRDCSGYKTTLTWGVGVASRGKLRGLSLPVVGLPQKPRRQSAPEEKEKNQWRHGAQPPPASGSGISNVSTTALPALQPIDAASAHHRLPHCLPTWPDFHDKNTWNPDASKLPLTSGPSSHPVNNVYKDAYTSFPQATTSGSSGSASTALVPPMVVGADTGAQVYHAGTSIPQGDLAPRQWSHTLNSAFQFGEGNKSESLGSLAAFTFSGSSPSCLHGERTVAEEEDAEEQDAGQSSGSHHSDSTSWFLDTSLATSLPQFLLDHSVGRTPRHRYLISYFAEVIAPVIVAFDSPTNPFRTHILRLAQESPTLQDAIAALSASNLRQRRESKILSTERTLPARRSSLALRALTDESIRDQYGIKASEDPGREELHYKRKAIMYLNAELRDPGRQLADSVLATLLMLCLFHICDTGVAKFQTQFAGVRRLLAMRKRFPGTEPEEIKWCTRMFTWFDTMTAAINDREGQLQGEYLDATVVSDEEWSLENLAGCDGQLFKTIAQLGRLNLLSQNKPVMRHSSTDMFAATAALPPPMTHYTTPYQDLLPSAVGVDGSVFPTLPEAERTGDALRAEFWREWYSIRQRLESWRIDAFPASWNTETPFSAFPPSTSVPPAHSYISPPSSPSPQCLVAPDNLADLSNISESFRYSAILYTERLAYPNLPSSHPRIQSLVLTALHYISAVQSDVYLLWPLFITGSECVVEDHRAVIRKRCKDIQKDSGFFNNISCLELLEKIWARNGNEGSETSERESATGPAAVPVDGLARGYATGPMGQPFWGKPSTTPARACVDGGRSGFRWVSVMRDEGHEGEYIVV